MISLGLFLLIFFVLYVVIAKLLEYFIKKYKDPFY